MIILFTLLIVSGSIFVDEKEYHLFFLYLSYI